MLDEHIDSVAKLTARNHELEAHYTHLQRTFEELNEVVIEQGKKLDSLERRLTVLARQLGSFSERDLEPRTLEDDKPPHY